LNNVVEPFDKDTAKCDAAYRQFTLVVLAITLPQVDDQQSIQVVIEKRDAFARLGAVFDKLFEKPFRQAGLERARSSARPIQRLARL
jgi:hypothetical protein